jgi:hypothetical protein
MQYRKTILKPGKYKVSRPDGTSTEEEITLDRMQRWASTANQMRGAGIKIPAPFAHADEEGNFPAPVRFENETLSDAATGGPIGWRADLNAGFWQNFMVDRVGLHAAVEVDGTPEDMTTPAGKVGKTVKDTSIFVLPSFTDGKGRKWGESIYHVALVADPVEPGQSNFVPVKADSPYALAMSLSMSNQPPNQNQNSGQQNSNQNSQSSGGGQKPPGTDPSDKTHEQDSENPSMMSGGLTIQDAIEALGTLPSPIILPEDTTPANLVERIVLLCRQKIADQNSNSNNEENGGRMTTKPQGSETKSPAIAMSQNQTPNSEADPKLAILMSNLVNTKKDSIKARIEALVKSGFVTQTYAETTLIPHVEGIQMSLETLNDKGEFPPSPVEVILSGLESAVAERLGKKGPESLLMSRLPNGATVVDKTDLIAGLVDGEDEELSDEYMDGILKRGNTVYGALAAK